MAHITLTAAQLKVLSTFSGVTVAVLYQLDPAGKVTHVAFFNNNGIAQSFFISPTITEADFISALNFPGSTRVETIE